MELRNWTPLPFSETNISSHLYSVICSNQTRPRPARVSGSPRSTAAAAAAMALTVTLLLLEAPGGALAATLVAVPFAFTLLGALTRGRDGRIMPATSSTRI